MKKLLTIILVLCALTSYGQWTKPQLYTKIDAMSTYQVGYMRALTDSIVKSMQLQLVSGSSLKTVNGTSLLGSGDLTITGGVWGDIEGNPEDQTDLQALLNDKASRLKTVNVQAGDYTVQDTDVDATIYLANGATPRTLTFPSDASEPIPVGAEGCVIQTGTGQITLAQDVGATVVTSSGVMTIPVNDSGENKSICWEKDAANHFQVQNGTGGFVPETRTIAGIDLVDDITVTEQQDALHTWRTPVYLTGSDFVTSSTTYVDVTGLSVSLTSGVKYEWETVLTYGVNATATGIGFAVDGPANTYLSYSQAYPNSTTAGAFVSQFTYNPTGTVTNASNQTTGNVLIQRGFVWPSADGSLIVRAAVENTGSQVLTVKGSSGSYIRVRIVH